MGCSSSKLNDGVPGVHTSGQATSSSGSAAVAPVSGLTALNLADSSPIHTAQKQERKQASNSSSRYRGASFGSGDSSGGGNSLSTAATPIGARRSSRGSSMPMLRSDGPPYLVASTRQARLAYIVLRSFVLQDWTTADRRTCGILFDSWLIRSCTKPNIEAVHTQHGCCLRSDWIGGL